MDRVALIDTSNMIYNALFGALSRCGLKKAEDVDPSFIGHVQQFRDNLDDIIRATHVNKLVFTLDSAPTHKFAIYPDYKGQRKPLAFNPKPAIMDMLNSWNYEKLKFEGYEADDIIASYVAQKFEEEEIVVISTDKDLWQVLDHPNTSIYDFSKQKYIDKTDLEHSFDIKEYSHIKLCKTLWGDSSDNVKNIMPRTQKYMLPFIKKSSDLESLKKNVNASLDSLSDICKKRWIESQDKIDINYQLVKLNYQLKI